MHVHVGPDVDVPRWDLLCAHKDVTAEASRTVNTDRVLSSMGCRRVQGDFAALVAVCRINGPCSLVPSVFEALAHLGDSWSRKGEGKDGGLAKHDFVVLVGCRVWDCKTEVRLEMQPDGLLFMYLGTIPLSFPFRS
jgi:hypothetical protein